MNTRLSSLRLKKGTSSLSKRKSLLRGRVVVLDTMLSLSLAFLAAVILIWLDGRQDEFDQLRDKTE
jgi:hypothetical protein